MVQVVQHKGLEEVWGDYSLAFQMANIGSEVSRSIKNRDKPARFKGAFERALELFDLTIEALAKKPESGGKLREVCRAREEFCDFFDENRFNTNPEQMQRYYDQFAMLVVARRQ